MEFFVELLEANLENLGTDLGEEVPDQYRQEDEEEVEELPGDQDG